MISSLMLGRRAQWRSWITASVRYGDEICFSYDDSMKFALWRGERVEVPCGTLQVKVQSGKPRRKLQRLRNVNTGKTEFQYISYPGRRRVVKFTPDLALDLTPLPPLPLLETAEQVEARQLASYARGAGGQGYHGGATTSRRGSPVHAEAVIAAPARV